MIRNITFDFADTIAQIYPPKEELIFDFFKKEYQLTIDIQKIIYNYKILDHLFLYSSLKILSDNERYKFYKKYNKKLIMNMGLYHLDNGIEKNIYEFFMDSSRKWILKPGVVSLFKQLKMNQINLAIISNFSSKLSKIIDELNIKHYINYFLVSQDVGLEKPNILFYKKFLIESSFLNSETIYIGDNYILDYLPATSLGIRTYLLDENDYFCLNKMTIKNIDEVSQLIN